MPEDVRTARLLERLSRSTFRARFHLSRADLSLIRRRGLLEIRRHAEALVRARLAPAVIPNDGRQTPWRGHPVFPAQHATACCCRGCLFKWQGIPAGRALTEEEVESVVELLLAWMRREVVRAGLDPEALLNPDPTAPEPVKTQPPRKAAARRTKAADGDAAEDRMGSLFD